MKPNTIDQFYGQQFINIETYRKNGTGVKTPVWFYQDGNKLYFTTEADSYKVKRIRANHNIQVAPCKVNGDLLGEWVTAKAELLDQNGIQRVNQLFRKKYGLQKWMFDILGKLRKREMTALAIQLPSDQGAEP